LEAQARAYLQDAGKPYMEQQHSEDSCEHRKLSLGQTLMIANHFLSPHPWQWGHVRLLTQCWKTQSLFVDLPVLTEAQEYATENKCL